VLGRSLLTQLLIGSLVPALLSLAAAGAVGYFLAQKTLEEQLGESLASDAALIASQVEGIRLLSVQPGDDIRGTRSYRALRRQLDDMRKAAGARRVFAVDLQGRVRADAGGGLPVGTPVPELARDRRELARAVSLGSASSQVLFSGPDGLLYRTGYAAVRQEGRPVGVVGVEGSAAFYQPLHTLARSYAALGVLALVILALVSVTVARGLTRPLRQLMRAAIRMGKGDLSTPIPQASTREMAVLARELDVMRQALAARDRQLQLMLGGIAHEVKNPLGGIELFAGLLREELPAGEGRRHVERILGELNYLKRVVEEFLTFAQQERFNRVPVEPERLVHGLLPLLGAEAEARQVRLHLAAEPALLEGDEGLLTAALVNLARNAIQASPAGSPVSVRGVRAGRQYLLQVEDAGAGIPEDVRERIFEPFFSTREKGTGLGLPLARKIVQAHGGSLEVASRPGRTLFTAALPVAPGAARSHSASPLR
jgi:signal transduction histidine kinase